MRVGAQARPADLAPVVLQVGLVEETLQVGAGVDAGGRVRLEVDQVAALFGAVAAEEVVESDFEQIGRGGIAGDMAAQFAIGAVGAHHHGQRIPAQRGAQPGFDLQVARVGRLRLHGDGIHIGARAGAGRRQALRCGMRRQAPQQEAGARAAGMRQHAFERVQPFARFLGIAVLVGRRQREHRLHTVCQVGHGTAPVHVACLWRHVSHARRCQQDYAWSRRECV